MNRTDHIWLFRHFPNPSLNIESYFRNVVQKTRKGKFTGRLAEHLVEDGRGYRNEMKSIDFGAGRHRKPNRAPRSLLVRTQMNPCQLYPAKWLVNLTFRGLRTIFYKIRRAFAQGVSDHQPCVFVATSSTVFNILL